MPLLQGKARNLKRQENRAVIAWRGAASAGLVSLVDRAYYESSVPRLTPYFGTKCLELVNTLTKSRQIFPSKLDWAGNCFRLSHLDCLSAKTAVDWSGWLYYPLNKWEIINHPQIQPSSESFSSYGKLVVWILPKWILRTMHSAHSPASILFNNPFLFLHFF